MGTLMKAIPGAVVDTVIYGLIALCLLVGVLKCLLPMLGLAGSFRRAIHLLEKMVMKDHARPIWQDSHFLGARMEKQWTRFLNNAEQLDLRGLTCDTEDFINDDTVLVRQANVNLMEMIPGILTSLGILGTFIGLMRGVSGLDVTSADATMSSISKMIGGMTFAYGTSIAGLSCSLFFNISARFLQRRATGALDDFHEAFRTFVMKRPLDSMVLEQCYMEDQARFLKNSVDGLGRQLTGGISDTVRQAFTPIGQQMNSFIHAQTEGQLKGLDQIVGRFVVSMDAQLSGQFTQLAQTLHHVNRQQDVSLEAINAALGSANTVVESMNQTHRLTQSIVERFEGYVQQLSVAETNHAHLTGEMTGLLNTMHQSLHAQRQALDKVHIGEETLKEHMQAYAKWSKQTLDAVEKRAMVQQQTQSEATEQLSRATRQMKESYAGYVQSLGEQFDESLAQFEKTMQRTLHALKTVMEQEQAAGSSLQAMGRLTEAVEALTAVVRQKGGV